MRLLLPTLTFLQAAVISARFIESHEISQVQLGSDADDQLCLIELADGETRLIPEDDKWELRRQNINFMDITDAPAPVYTTEMLVAMSAKGRYPLAVSHEKEIRPLLKELSKTNMKDHLTTFTAFHTRYYKSEYGRQSSAWLFDTVSKTVEESGAFAHGATVRNFSHPWGQNSIIASFPGKSNKTIIISAHQDSVNLFLPSVLRAPGADDDGSGTVTIIEALRVFLLHKDFVKGKAENTVEFIWFSAEEGGLLGSQAIFKSYAEASPRRDIAAHAQTDMTGSTAKTKARHGVESIGVIMDFVDLQLTEYIKLVIDAYLTIPWVETICGYACSDHASSRKYGYPSAFVIESAFPDSSADIHTSGDVLEKLDFDHMLQHARLTLGLVFELAFTRLK